MSYIAGTVNKIFAATATTTVTNTVTPTSLIPTGTGSLTRPANYFGAGRTVQISLGGYCSMPALSAITIIVKIGSTTIASGTSTSGLFGNFTNQGYRLGIILNVLTSGVTGQVAATGTITINNVTLNIFTGTSTPTINTTISNTLDVTITWDSATTSRTITTNVCQVLAAS